MNNTTTTAENGSAASPELTCDHCHRAVPETFEVITGRACESCTHELKWGQLLEELYAM